MGVRTGSNEYSCDALLRGRLGSELALIYHDTLQAPLPPRLRALLERLDRPTRPRRDQDAQTNSPV